MSNKIKFNKSLVAVVVSSALLSACGGDDKTTVEPAAVSVPAPAIEVTPVVEVLPAPVADAPAEVVATTSLYGSVINGKTRLPESGLVVEVHVNGAVFEGTTDETVNDEGVVKTAGTFFIDDLPQDSDFLVVVTDPSNKMAPAYYQSSIDNNSLVTNAISVFEAKEASVTVNDVLGANVSGLTLYIPGTDLSAKNLMVNIPDNIATEVNGKYTFMLPDNGETFAVKIANHMEFENNYDVIGQNNMSISAGNNAVINTVAETAVIDFSIALNFVTADGASYDNVETIEAVCGSASQMAMVANGACTVKVNQDALDAGTVTYMLAGMAHEIKFGPSQFDNGVMAVNVVVSAEHLANEQDQADQEQEEQQEDWAAAELDYEVSSSLIANDEMKVVVKFTQPVDLVRDVVVSYQDFAVVEALYDTTRPFYEGVAAEVVNLYPTSGNCNGVNRPPYDWCFEARASGGASETGGIGMLAANNVEGYVDADGISYELPLRSVTISVIDGEDSNFTDNDLNVANWDPSMFTAGFVPYYRDAKTLEADDIFDVTDTTYRTIKPGLTENVKLGFSQYNFMNGMTTWYWTEYTPAELEAYIAAGNIIDDYGFKDTTNYEILSVQLMETKADAEGGVVWLLDKSGLQETGGDRAFNIDTHTAKYKIVDGEVSDRISYYPTDASAPVDIDFPAQIPMGFYNGYFDGVANANTETLSAENYHWNEDRTILTIIGDASMVKDDLSYSFDILASSKITGELVQISSDATAVEKLNYNLDDLSVQRLDNLDQQQYVLLDEFSEEANAAKDFTMVSLPKNSAVSNTMTIPNLMMKDDVAVQLALDNQNLPWHQAIYSSNATKQYSFINNLDSRLTYIVSPVELSGTLTITSATYETVKTENFESSQVSMTHDADAILRFGTESGVIDGVTNIAPIAVYNPMITDRFYVREGSVANLTAVYPGVSTLLYGASDSVKEGVSYIYQIPTAVFNADSGIGGYTSFEADVNININGEMVIQQGVEFKVH